ncbi:MULTISPECIES: hypothetical protein [unclassified Allomuricauda]|uniref:hypothetical protein n=2 Tax=unclassified Allomuricauda TaxID=2615049 RepID=UPI00273F355C|nr:MULTISPECIES: hypothetical protein [unclassified Allomuricauda]
MIIVNEKMNKFLIIIVVIVLFSCGSGLEPDGPNSQTYIFILSNNTGVDLWITSDFNRKELIMDGDLYQCQMISEEGYQGGLCSGELEIRFYNTNLGYQCFGLGMKSKGLCFTEDYRLFTISEGTIFTEIAPRTYEYVLTPELLEGAFELPD